MRPLLHELFLLDSVATERGFQDFGNGKYQLEQPVLTFCALDPPKPAFTSHQPMQRKRPLFLSSFLLGSKARESGFPNFGLRTYHLTADNDVEISSNKCNGKTVN